MGFGDNLKHAWNALIDGPDDLSPQSQVGVSYGSVRPDRIRLSNVNERTIVGAIYNRLAVDFSGAIIRHVRLDDQARYLDEINSGLNNCLMLEANIDQAARAFKQDVALSLFDKGVVAIAAVDTSLNPIQTGGYDVLTMRVGYITRWFPRHVRVSVWNDRVGRRQEVTLEKKNVAIFENPFYTVMNEPNSTLQRLIRKLALLDAVDEQSGSGKLDLIIQLPYSVKSETRRQQAERRRNDIEFQLKGSRYGIAYTDGTEKITQLNRPSENNLLAQITYLTELLYGQLGLTPEIMNGTADAKTMTNYNDRTIEPILDAMTQAMERTFLTKTARTQGQAIRYYIDPFKLIPIDQLSEVADKFTRNEILSSNEIRQAIGVRPSSDPRADELRNSNLPAPSERALSEPQVQEGDYQNGS